MKYLKQKRKKKMNKIIFFMLTALACVTGWDPHTGTYNVDSSGSVLSD